MTYLNFSKAATMAALFIITSCIFDAPNDQFYRTRWTTSEAPFEGLIIEFKCDGYISASSEYDSCMLLGRYEPSGNEAYFTDLYVCYDSYTIVIEEAHLSENNMIINWHISDTSADYAECLTGTYTTGISYTTSFHLVTQP